MKGRAVHGMCFFVSLILILAACSSTPSPEPKPTPAFRLYSISRVGRDSVANTLISVDQETGEQALVGASGQTPAQQSLDRDPISGQLFGVDPSKAPRVLFKIDPNTGIVNREVTISSTVTAIAFAPTGELYGIVAPKSLGRINLQDGKFTRIGVIEAGTNIASIAFSSVGTLYAAARVSNPFAQSIVTVNPENAAVTSTVPTGKYDIGDIDCSADNYLYATNFSRALLKIDPNTGAQTIVGHGDKGSLSGIASAPLP